MSIEVLKSVAINQSLYNCGYKKESSFILSYLLKNGYEDCELVETDKDNWDLINWFDNLSADLTDKYDCGYPLFTVVTGIYEVLSTYYSTYDLNLLRPNSLETLYSLQTEDRLFDYIDINEAVKDLRTVLTVIFKNMNINRLNEVLKDIAVYNKCAKVEDIVFIHNCSLFINYSQDNNEYIKSSITDLFDFIEDITDSFDYFEDFQFIFEDILTAEDIKLDVIK